MTSFAPCLIAASAAIILLLGLIHLAYTFRGILAATALYIAALLARGL